MVGLESSRLRGSQHAKAKLIRKRELPVRIVCWWKEGSVQQPSLPQPHPKTLSEFSLTYPLLAGSGEATTMVARSASHLPHLPPSPGEARNDSHSFTVFPLS